MAVWSVRRENMASLIRARSFGRRFSAQPPVRRLLPKRRIAASIDRAMGEIRKVRRVQQAASAFADAEIKMLLTCMAEPPREVRDLAVAVGKLRYDRFLKSVGMGVVAET
jgi:hypothetical protein